MYLCIPLLWIFSIFNLWNKILTNFFFSFKNYFNWSYKHNREKDIEKVSSKNTHIALYLMQSFRKHTLKFHQTLKRSRQKFLVCYIFLIRGMLQKLYRNVFFSILWEEVDLESQFPEYVHQWIQQEREYSSKGRAWHSSQCSLQPQSE